MAQAHKSVLLREFLHFFEGRSIRCFVDGTLGAGGHAAALLEAHPEIETFVGIDRDPQALAIAAEVLSPWKDKITLIQGRWSQSRTLLAPLGLSQVDGFFLDLGVSSMQLDRPERGFSFLNEGPLDMRMDPGESLSAEEVVNTFSEEELGRIFRDYGEEKYWRGAARAIVQARQERPLRTTKDLVDVILSVIWQKKGKIHPATLVFQALRICVNRELEEVEKGLPSVIDLLSSEARLGVISFHRLEDRRVKELFRYEASDKQSTSGIGGLFLEKEPRLKLLTRKPLMPSEEELEENWRSRSAKMRFVEKL